MYQRNQEAKRQEINIFKNYQIFAKHTVYIISFTISPLQYYTCCRLQSLVYLYLTF